jgi:hypothetical protein
LISLLKNRITKEKMVIIKMENEDEESKRIGKNWVDGESITSNCTMRKMELEFAKSVKKQGKF